MLEMQRPLRLKRRSPKSSLDIPDQNKKLKLKLCNEVSSEKFPAETKRNQPESENFGCDVHPKVEKGNYQLPLNGLTPNVEEQIRQPRNDEEKHSSQMPFSKSPLMKGSFKNEDKENLEPQQNEQIVRSKSITSVLSGEKDDESNTFKKPLGGGLRLMKRFQMGIKTKKPVIAKSESQPCVYAEGEPDKNEKFKMLSNLKIKKSKSKSYDCVLTQCENEEQESKNPLRAFVKHFPRQLKRKQKKTVGTVGRSKSCDDFIAEEENKMQNGLIGKKKSSRLTLGLEKFFGRGKKRNESIKIKQDDDEKEPMVAFPGLSPVEASTSRARIHQAKSQDYASALSENEGAEEEPMVTFPGLPPTEPSTSRAQIHQAKSQDCGSALSENEGAEEEPMVTFPGLPPTQPSTSRARIHQTKSQDCGSALSENEDAEKEPMVTFPGLPPKQPSTFRTQIHQAKSQDYASALAENEDAEKEPMVTFPGLPPTQPSTSWAQIHQAKSQDYASALSKNEDAEKEPMVAFPGLPPTQPSTSRAQIHQAKSQDYGSALSENKDEDKENMVACYKFSEEPIGFGAPGTCVYSGVNTKDGRKVAIKKKHFHTKKQSSDYKKEIEYLLRLRHCSNVVNYLDVEVRKDVVYIVLELMEGTLEALVNRPNPGINFVELSRDMINALQFLHNVKIVHRDIKPRNILYVSSPRLKLKLADFGLSKMIGSDSSSIGYNGGTRCWMAPEVHESLKTFSTASDVFATGLVLHFLMTSRHPFAPIDVKSTKDNRIFVEHKTVDNIINQNLNADNRLSQEALHLISQMVNHDKEQRPNADEVLAHPFFWSNQKKMKFLEAAANQPETYKNGANDFKRDLESTILEGQFQTLPWSEQSPTMVYIYSEMNLWSRKYNTTSVAELLRFMRNAYQHVSVPGRTPLFQKFMLRDFVFLNDFETLFITIYETVRKHKWHENKEELKYAISYAEEI